MPSGCAQAFREIAEHYARLHERGSSIEKKLDLLSRAVIGDGDTRHSLASRVERLEAASARTWRLLGLCVAVLAVVVAVIGVLK
jgi:t-SNARE complex subunit (syntaxin)